MERCESKTDRGCARVATWKQSVYVGGNVKGRVEYYSHWCDAHAESIAQKRRTNLHAEATMTRIPEEIA
jgi:hypothetical protein